MVGYGDCHGLYAGRQDQKLWLQPSETHDMTSFDRLKPSMDVPHYAVRNLHAYSLRKHRGDIIGIWPGAAEFARRNKLCGLFTEDFVLDRKDAEARGIITPNMHIDEANLSLCRTLIKLMAQQVLLCQISKKLAESASGKLSLLLPTWVVSHVVNGV